MSNLPPLTSRINRGFEGGGEFERLLNQLLLEHADKNHFEYVPAGSAGGDRGVDGLAPQGGVPGLQGPVAFQFKWLWDRIDKGDKARQITDSLARSASSDDIQHWVLVTPHELSPAERDWFYRQTPREDLQVHHWGQARIEQLLRACPPLFARYYPHEAKELLIHYDGHDFGDFAAAYRRKLVLAHQNLRTLGFPPKRVREEDAGREIPLHKIFVAQEFLAQQGGERRQTLVELLEEGRSCVLLGDAGMGKTTLLKFVTLLACGEAELDDFVLPAGVVPLLIPIRDFLKLQHDEADLGFLEYLESRARSDLSLPHAHRAFFEATLRMGEGLLLIDGLDEAGGDASRHRISNVVKTFLAEFPMCSCWVTSRVYGYTRDVALPGDKFVHYRVGRLEDRQIDAFIARWYAIQYSDNPREQAERVASLQSAVRRNPSVRRLAGNPLLLTLMAFIHYGQRKLPQDRGELYDQCLEMLLNSWVNAKRDDRAALNVAGHRFEELRLRVATQIDYLAHLALHIQELNQAAEDEEGRGLIRHDQAIECLARRHLQRSRRDRSEMEIAEAREEMEHFVDYVSDRTGLLIDKGGGQLSFIHLSFQEYLDALLFTFQKVDENEQRRFFESHLGESAWEEVLLLRLWIILHKAGGGAEERFDTVISSLLRKLERQPEPNAWLTLARAVRDDLEFSQRDRRAIIEQALAYWLADPPRFEGNWFAVLEEICLFSPRSGEELCRVLDHGARADDLSRAAACSHLLDRLKPSEGRSHIVQHPKLAVRLDSLLEELAERGVESGWRQNLCFVFESLLDSPLRQTALDRLAALIPPLRSRCETQGERSGGVWNLAILMGDCLQLLKEREGDVPEALRSCFIDCVFRAIDQEISVRERQTLALALGRLDDPRIALDLRVPDGPEKHPGYVQVPAGRYLVGDGKEPITIAEPFWLSKYPVTNSQYALFIEAGGYECERLWSEEGWEWVGNNKIKMPAYWGDALFNSPNQPVVGVSWWEADAYCRWAELFLPTADQAEAAARGPKGFEYPWGDTWEDGICNSEESGLGSSSAVGIFPRDSSPFGLEDMAGNVWEWCSDTYGAVLRVFRGGGWGDGAGSCRAARRYGLGPEYRDVFLGFRVAAVPLSPEPA